jgi:hypothetical protein
MAGSNRFDPSVGQRDFERAHVVRRRAIDRHPRAGGIIRDHSAESRARTGRDIRTETKAVWFEKGVELIEDDATADAHRSLLEIERADLSIVAREIDDQTIANCAAGEATAGTAGRDRNTRSPGRQNDCARLLCVPGEGDGCGLNLVKRGVGRVNVSGAIIEGDLAIRRNERALLSRRHRSLSTFVAPL